MKHFNGQAQLIAAADKAGYKIVGTEMRAGYTIFAFDGDDLMGHFDPEMNGTLAEDKWESRNMECEIVHIRLFDLPHPAIHELNKI